jgi:hypothetical protein
LAYPVYTHRLVGIENHTGWGEWVNDTGQVAIVRDVEIVGNTDVTQTVQCSVQGQGFFLKAPIGPGNFSSSQVHWDGRVVVLPGETLMYFSQQPASFVITGYLLTAG